MQTQLFPTEIIENSVESHHYQVSMRSQWIYTFLLLALLAAFVSLFFIHIDVSVRASGILRPITEKTELKAAVNGKIKEIYIKENQTVKQGEKIIILESEILDNKLKLIDFQLTEKKSYIQDLEYLVKIDSNVIFSFGKGQQLGLKTQLYKQQYLQLKTQLQENQYAQEKIQREIGRDKKLYEGKAIALREYEDRLFELQRLQSQFQTSFEKQISLWQSELSNLQIEIEGLQSQQKQANKEKEFYTITAPISGTVQQFVGKYIGNQVQVGESIASISPDSSLVADCYVSPKDIGLLQKGMKANFQIDAFNYNEWGMMSGEIQSVSNDISIVNNQPLFLIKCKLDQSFLSLKNSYKGYLKKGMTVKARFVITNRNLFALLYDKAENWLKPSP
ncbi:MAG: HlyD family efflux transporter periplasmic adaptor subunit [Cytophagales bacterium]|nr:MAG: HlyD family efflux transporter periplasmic adaptor subunit [Cytophagales bacterium]